ncbi:Lipase member H [Eumeta japonica]|uniref:Lipase member H n=1 Tax=Eumeta variegata TaxID=151549 RepID=A0A4C1SIB5_EUMVA|nr:Lipase member H [Eumeta japonica]
MVTTITQNGVSPKNFHCIGHSLGAQMLGQMGDHFFKNTGQKLARITGLDPAGPCFSNSLIEEQIRSGVADYVEIYHCNAGALGTTSVLGDVDFFANKRGSSQPDCGTPLIPGILQSSMAAKCNHRTCLSLYLETITHPDWFPATACDSYKQYKKGTCSLNDKTVAGFWNPGCGWESLMKNVTLGNVTMSHRTRERPARPCVSLPLNYDRSAARSTRN